MNKKKKFTNTSTYPDEVIDRLARAFYPAILACWNSEEGQRSLVGARPLHLANARPFGRLKAPLGLSLLRCAAQTRACLWQAEQAHHANNEKQEVPTGELPVVHIAIVCGFWQGASGWTHPVFVSSWLGVRQNAFTGSLSPWLHRGWFCAVPPSGRTIPPLQGRREQRRHWFWYPVRRSFPYPQRTA